MREAIHDRVMLVQQEKTTSLTRFAEEVGVDKSTISKINTGATPVSRAVIAMIVYTYPDISGKWLETGEGSMYAVKMLHEPSVEYFNKEDELYNYPKLVKKVRELDQTVREIKKIIDLNDE